MTTDVASTASGIVEQFSDHADIDQDEVESDLKELVGEFKVPLDEAERTVRNNLMDEHGIEQGAVTQSGAAPDSEDLSDDEFSPTPVEDINEADEWHDLLVDVIELWDPSHPDMAQVGLIGDDTDIIKFVIWENDGEVPVELLEEGETYEINNVVSDEYNGRYSVKLNSSTSITQVEGQAADGRSDNVVVDGVLVAVKSGSGLIKRCPDEDCTRVLQNGRCSEHGEVEGEFDLRIKAVVDNGAVAQNVVFDQEATEDVADIELEEAKQMAMDALDTGVVAQEISNKVLGQYFKIEGPELGQNVLVENATATNSVDDDQIQSLQDRLQAEMAETSAGNDSQQADAAA
ncbi:replication factor A [Halosimplex pelagicum]|uniref:Replication factor A n=1 Tax=Halosimplex pelagicum TaxID=869886 RepID=A0A7D5P6Z1_9EURY|nr:replication factor A [Halosimplex pelagicum]QLH82306.1 replication factor A [Halosimplex pelagicum]